MARNRIYLVEYRRRGGSGEHSEGSKMSGTTMHAIVRRRYGPPDVVSYEEVARPVTGEHDVLVRVLAAGVSIGDHHVVTGKPYVIRPKVGGARESRPVQNCLGPNRLPGQSCEGRYRAGAWADSGIVSTCPT